MTYLAEYYLKNDLKEILNLCKEYVGSLGDIAFDRATILSWFEILCAQLTKIINLIKNYCKEAKENVKSIDQNTILLFLTQMLTTLSLLINVFVQEEEHQLVITEARICFQRQIIHCLDCLDNAINSENSSVVDTSGNFVKWVDTALGTIAEIDIEAEDLNISEIFNQTRDHFEEVLAHAMSIAQISLEEDSKIIRGSSQTVLDGLTSLQKEINKKKIDKAMVNLFIDECSTKLCALERKVNSAVLKLCLQTFSEFTLPLEKVQSFCYNSANKGKMKELDNLVADFDLHVDRIMQIGLFAVSCSSDVSRGIKIRSSLASLEALESELVPALTSVLLDNSEKHRNCGKLLMTHWHNQALTMQHLIYLIIDPFAFCQIIYDEASHFVDNFNQSIQSKTIFKKDDIKKILDIAEVLENFVEKAQCEFTATESIKIKSNVKDFKNEEVKIASNILLSDENISLENCLRILKRCKILLTVIKRIWYCFIDNSVCAKSIQSEENPADENVKIDPTGNPFIDHIINRGRQILEDRSVLYRTPIKSNSNQSKCAFPSRKEIPLSKLIHLRQFSFVNTTAKNETTLDLQITEILDEMTNLSTVFK